MFLPISRDSYLPCTKADPEVFFPELPDKPTSEITNDDRKTYQTQVSNALAICNSCEYTVECLKYALENKLQGIWGATTDEDRKRIRHQLNLQKRREKQKSAP